MVYGLLPGRYELGICMFCIIYISVDKHIERESSSWHCFTSTGP